LDLDLSQGQPYREYLPNILDQRSRSDYKISAAANKEECPILENSVALPCKTRSDHDVRLCYCSGSVHFYLRDGDTGMIHGVGPDVSGQVAL